LQLLVATEPCDKKIHFLINLQSQKGPALRLPSTQVIIRQAAVGMRRSLQITRKLPPADLQLPLSVFWGSCSSAYHDFALLVDLGCVAHDLAPRDLWPHDMRALCLAGNNSYASVLQPIPYGLQPDLAVIGVFMSPPGTTTWKLTSALP
jgi:hypothetical protein